MPAALTAPSHLFCGHRAILLERLRALDAAALFWAAPQTYQGPHLARRFRQDSEFWYLTGLDEPDAALLLLPGRSTGESILFLRPRDAAEERWEGPRLGLEGARDLLGCEETRPIQNLWSDLPELLSGRCRLVLPQGLPEHITGRLAELPSPGPGQQQLERLDSREVLLEQRLIKGLTEQQLLRHAAEISAQAHLDVMRHLRQAKFEAEIEGRLLWNFRRAGAREAYPSMVASGRQVGVLHDHRNQRALSPGGLVLVDAGAEVAGYISDVTRTLPFDGRFQGPQRELYQAVFAIQEQLIAALRPGLVLAALEGLASRLQIDALRSLGLLSGDPEGLFERGFTRHRVAHFVGLDVHDCGAEALHGERRLEPGMVLAIEPGLYVDPHELAASAPWRGQAARIEDVLMVTDDGADLLTYGAPRHPDDVEAACLLSELGPR
jgi:Xaa-Pro aminopeptidase